MKWPITVTINIKFPELSERQWVTIGLFCMTTLCLVAAFRQPTLWNIDLFKIILQGLIGTGILNMVLAFHFSANKSDEARVINTAKAFDAIKATATAVQTVAPVVDAATGKSGDPVHVVDDAAN